MTFKERIDSLKAKLQGKIKQESTADEIAEINDLIAELDGLNTDYDGVMTEQSKLKDQIVKMVLSEGSGKKPVDESSGSKSMTIEEAIAEVESQGGK